MKNDQILSQISEFCRQSDMAETTFGRRVVNDGKHVIHKFTNDGPGGSKLVCIHASPTFTTEWLE